jgi:hypothetical protein
MFENIKALDFQHCCTIPEGFRELGILFPHLELFKIVVNFGETAPDLTGDPPSDLNDALAAMTNLFTLIIEARYGKRGLRSHDCRSTLGTLKLALLSKLATIKIPAPMLIEEQGTDNVVLDDNLATILPKSLKRLILTIHVRPNPRRFHTEDENTITMTCTPNSIIIGLMEALLRLGHSKLTHLEEVVCCYSMKGHTVWAGFEKDDIMCPELEEVYLFDLDAEDGQRLHLLRMSIQSQSIRFSATYEGLYSPHARFDEPVISPD